ncbi:GNAT family N-acetyltransferase [Microbacterium pseudoresistens]|uniref:GNAT superfamily N-acetyltransferase n=1 Tax=Microbacterium pseudoresistens TaxID=640634 RepID=A0A7Y9JMV8_9MICO|nr:GNAT family N-acetyltransferase [Microbacterium pseudoresistens]NYD55237.1 GNAT superfamily N-acetyltransferase [Microbacterium pseudoresistens]
MTNDIDTIAAAEPVLLAAGATLRPLVLPARADAAPSALLRAYADVRNASILESTGRTDDALTADELLPVLRSSRTTRKQHWYIERDDELIGCVAVDILGDSGGETAILTIAVLAAHSGHGIGTTALAQVEQQLRAVGVTKLLGWAEHRSTGRSDGRLEAPTGFGSIPLDHSARFLQQTGFGLEQIERVSAFFWTADAERLLRTHRDGAQEHAGDYRIVQWMWPTPPEHIDGFAWLKSRMSTDVPDAEMGMPEEMWDAARVAEMEERQAAKGFTVQVTAAQHIETGELCAFNELAISIDRPSDSSHQFDTLVLKEHRGHRLGMLVKCAGLLRWHERFPESARVVTYNAEENRPMLSINEAIGFAPIGYEGAWKKLLS